MTKYICWRSSLPSSIITTTLYVSIVRLKLVRFSITECGEDGQNTGMLCQRKWRKTMPMFQWYSSWYSDTASKWTGLCVPSWERRELAPLSHLNPLPILLKLLEGRNLDFLLKIDCHFTLTPNETINYEVDRWWWEIKQSVMIKFNNEVLMGDNYGNKW